MYLFKVTKFGFSYGFLQIFHFGSVVMGMAESIWSATVTRQRGSHFPPGLPVIFMCAGFFSGTEGTINHRYRLYYCWESTGPPSGKHKMADLKFLLLQKPLVRIVREVGCQHDRPFYGMGTVRLFTLKRAK